LYPRFTGRGLAMPRSVPPIFWLMSVGALGMVIGPWTGIDRFTVVGLGLHTAGTVWLLANVIIPLLGQRAAWADPGLWHLLIAYVWFLLAAVVAPLVVAGGGTGAEVAGSGGPILIYGWMLQVGFALLPYIFGRAFRPGQPAHLGGTWLSLAAINFGSLMYWLSLFLTTPPGPLRGLAYLSWITALIPVLVNLRAIVSSSAERIRALDAFRFSP
jgi:cytochrome c oxidase cbb3-type subunit 1